jgi:basic amino acid/polyamine antiporter, APA family
MRQIADQSAPVPTRLVGLPTATAIVVANMVGTGVFTSLGFQVAAVPSVFGLIALWVLGGVYALCGAWSYGELASLMPRSGGEYHYLSRIYHPTVGFLAGWVSITAGFAAPVAAASMALGKYASHVWPGLSPTGIALAAVAMVSVVHLFSVRIRSGFQDAFTAFKLVLVAGLVVCGFVLAKPQPVTWMPATGDLAVCFSGPFAVSLVYVTYAYSGWNASVYLAEEVKDPAKTVPRSLLAGTLIVTVLYVLLNSVFLYSTSTAALKGQLEVGYLAAANIFGASGARIVACLISVGLISSISSMVWAGPRVLLVMGQDLRAFRTLSRENAQGVPYRAVLLQLGIVVALVLTASFEAIISYLGFTLALSTFLTVLGVMVHRRRQPGAPRPYRTWGYPVTPLFFLGVTGWMLAYLIRFRPAESIAGLVTLAIGWFASWLGAGRARAVTRRTGL